MYIYIYIHSDNGCRRPYIGKIFFSGPFQNKFVKRCYLYTKEIEGQKKEKKEKNGPYSLLLISITRLCRPQIFVGTRHLLTLPHG